jgi:dihydroorotate dehydrogenase
MQDDKARPATAVATKAAPNLLVGSMYRSLFNLALRRLEPERAHELAKRSLRLLTSNPPGRAVVRRLAGDVAPSLEIRALGLTFASPIGVAAGLDKDATWAGELAALGFGFVEVGTVTALAQPGNPKPRIARIVERRALVNRMGFPNRGADAVAARLARLPHRGPIGVNVGKSRTVSLEEAAEDYRRSVSRVAPVADFIVLNVSSPNTPGLRSMQEGDQLTSLVGAVRAELADAEKTIPLLVKLSPDLGDEQVDTAARLALELELDGIIAVNTTVDRTGLGSAHVPFEGGGVSGRPLQRRAVDVLRRLRGVVGDQLVLVSVGGVESADDVWERILVGASLVQAYTAFVYEGPGWPGRLNRELERRVRAIGAASLQELVGTGAPASGEERPARPVRGGT